MEAMIISDNTTGNGITFYEHHIIQMSALVYDKREETEEHATM
jgi:hypothetical protein